MSVRTNEELRRLFDRVLATPAAERLALLERECAGDSDLRRRVEAMIAAAEDERTPTGHDPLRGATPLAATHAAGTPRATHAAHTESDLADTLREGPGTLIGPYKLLQQIGEGGFGAVFMAEQDHPVRRRVALKIIKLGMDTRQVVARFEQERQALAMMDHPNIARVIDAGATQTGRPYFVMDLVKGDPIVEYCDKNHLSIDERLDLFAQVCNAVQHAHTKGIIHRDLKPSNILVSTQDGRPSAKVIDFGIAKATSAKLTDKTLFTEHNQVIGTVHYMSPEQAEGSLDIDTRTDVYALGVVLYELLTGSTPFDAKTFREAFYSEVQRIIREVEPPKPSTRLHQSSDGLAYIAASRGVEPKRLGALVRGELDWIVMKALEKDRARRYESPHDLAADVRNYLDGKDVVAAPPSAAYRFKKFVRRHRLAVTAGAAVAAALLAGVIAFAWQARVAQHQRDDAIAAREAEAAARAKAQLLGESEAEQRAIAEANGRKAAAINQFLLDMLGSANIRQLGRDAKVSQALDRAAVRVETAFEDRPEVEAAVRRILGATYQSIGMLDASEPHIEAALALNRRLYGDESIELAQSLSDQASLKSGRGDYAAAADLLGQAVEIATQVNGPEDALTLGMQSDYANALARVNRDSEAEAILRELLEIRTRLYGPDNADNQVAMNSLAVLLHGQGRLDEAEALYRDAVDLGSRVLGPDHPDTLTARVNLASLLRSRRQFAECEPLMVAALADSRRVFGDSHPKTAGAAWALAGLYRDQGRYKEALPFLEECAAIRRRDEGERSAGAAEVEGSLAMTLKFLGEVDRAVTIQRGVAATYAELHGAEAERTLNARLSLANTLTLTKGSAEAEGLFRELLESCPRLLGDDHEVTIIATNSYGVFLMGQGRYADAEPYVRKALDTGRRAEGEDSENTIITQCNMAKIECELGRLEEGERLFRDAIERFARVFGPDHLHLANARSSYGRTLARLGRNDEACRELTEAIAISKKALGGMNPRFCKDALELGRCLQELGRFDEAEKTLVDAHETLVAARPPGHADIDRVERALAELEAARK